MHRARSRLTAVFEVIGSENINHPMMVNTKTPMAKPNNLDSHTDPLKADMKWLTL